MSSAEESLYESAASATARDVYQGLDSSVVIYGIVADILLLGPILIYLFVNDSNRYAQYHQTYVNMLCAAYGPIGIIWWIVLADDSRMAREALTGAVEMAGLGPFALLWVGYLSFLMSAQSAAALSANVVVWMWAIIYFVLNVTLIVAHWYLSPPIYAWIATAPLPEKVKTAEDASDDSVDQDTADVMNDTAITISTTVPDTADVMNDTAISISTTVPDTDF